MSARLLAADNDATAIEKRLADSARYLASDELEGRGIGTKGLDLAADYIAGQFELMGLKTALFDGEPFQRFSVTTSAELGSNNELAFVGPASAGNTKTERIELKLGHDFSPLEISGSGQIDLPLVFVGYGITGKSEQYDDYADVDVEGKAVVILRHEPRQDDPQSKFNGTKHSEHALLHRKVSNAYAHGAAAVVFYTDEFAVRKDLLAARRKWLEALDRLAAEHEKIKNGEAPPPAEIEQQRQRIDGLLGQVQDRSKRLAEGFDPVLPFHSAAAGDARRDFPVVHCRRSVLDRVVKAALETDLGSLEKQIDEGPSPQSRALSGWRLVGRVDVGRTQADVRNVLGLLEGEGPLAQETIIVGAHYDHLGWGGRGSLEPNKKAVHNGADDNASGVSVMIEIARTLAARPEPPRRSVLFIAFTGEESGLLGSSHYVNNPLVPLENTVAMLNLDMVGMLRDDKLMVLGSGTAERFGELLDAVNRERGLNVVKKAGGVGPSDQTVFYAKKVPVMHFFTGTHKYYHRPSDDFERLSVPGMRRVGQFVTDVVVALLDDQPRPQYVAVQIPRVPRGGGQRPYFGSVPDFGYNGEGYGISGVAPGGPAERAGLEGGDVIVRFGDSKIGNLEDFDAALRKYEGGDRVKTIVLRNGEETTFEITLEPPQ